MKLAACLILFVGLVLGGASPVRGQVADVERAFADIPAESRSVPFRLGEFDLPQGGHLQGIQMRVRANGERPLVFLSHDSDTEAYLCIVPLGVAPRDALPPDQQQTVGGRVLHVHRFPSDGQSPPLRHAGGIQLAGDILVVGLEDNQLKTRSEIQFWDVSDPQRLKRLRHLTITRRGPVKDKTAGAVGLVRRENDHLVAVANWDSRALDFYVSNGKPLADPACRFSFDRRWRDDKADKQGWQPDRRFGSHQAIQLVSDATGSIFLVGFNTASDGRDLADLFSVDMNQETGRLLRKRASRPIDLGKSSHFRSTGGIAVVGNRFHILSSEHHLHATTRLSITD